MNPVLTPMKAAGEEPPPEPKIMEGNERAILSFLREEIDLLADGGKFRGPDSGGTLPPVPSVNSHPLMLNAVLTVLYPDWLRWEPETAWTVLGEDWSFKLSRPLKDRIQALRAFHTSPAFKLDVTAFENISDAWNYLPVDFGIQTVASPGEITHTLMIAGAAGDDTVSERIKKYIAACCKEAGLLHLPGPLSRAQEYLDLLLPDAAVPVKELTENIYSDYLKGNPLAVSGESPEGIQLTRLLALHEYVDRMLDMFRSEVLGLMEKADGS